ncbi:hypothetical protein DRW41_12115 [Neobacillus piezotolerans]|uniref:DUF4083 domain-containing protein n=2 Tax=Neobacillus piezotolerans TaxID=2259171 RepID=A0A3D8GQT1_9BACI|nr:hypothetical protein DRW41_12115 [Neobacillus piezotolerans]
MKMGDVISQLLPLVLMLVFFVSLGLFVNRLVRNQKERTASTMEIERKLDHIIKLLEKQQS